jgi:Flp pilus assembly protein TadG
VAPSALMKKKRATRGGALIEMTLVLLLLIVLTFGAMEYGWMFFRIQQVTNAARNGVRMAVLPDASSGDVQTTVDNMMSGFGVYSGSYSVGVSPSDVSSAATGEAITVSVVVPYSDLQLTGMSIFPVPANLSASATMAKEGP